MQLVQSIFLSLLLLTTPALALQINWFSKACGAGGGYHTFFRSPGSACFLPIFDVYSGYTTANSNECLYSYYGSNCESGTVVAIQKGNTNCGNYCKYQIWTVIVIVARNRTLSGFGLVLEVDYEACWLFILWSGGTVRSGKVVSC